MTKVERAIRDWLNQYPDHTTRSYTRSWHEWLDFLDGESPLKARKATAQAFHDYLLTERLPPLSGPSVRNAVSGCSSAYRYLIGEELARRNPFAAIRRNQAGGATRYGLSKADTIRLLQTAGQHSPRAYALVALICITGLRVSEVCTASLENVRSEAGIITLEVQRKRGRTGKVAIPANLHRVIREVTDNATTGPIVPGPRGGRPIEWQIRQLLRELGDQIDVDGLHPHQLRHTAATLAIQEAGKTLEEVQDLMGHASPETTRNYIRGLNTLERSPSFDLDRLLLGGTE